MNDYFKESLRVFRVDLVNNVEYDNLRDLILQYKTLPESIVETIDSLPNRRDKVRKMLECLPRRPDDAFLSFLAALCRSEQTHIARKLYQTTMDIFTDDRDKKWFEKEANKQISIGEESGKEFPTEEKTSEQEAVLGQPQMRGPSWNNPAEPVENSISMSLEKQRRRSCIERMESEVETGYFDLRGCPSSSKGNDSRPSSWPIQTQHSPFNSSPSQSHKNPPGSNPITSTNNMEPISAYRMDSNPRGLLLIITKKGLTGPPSGGPGPVPTTIATDAIASRSIFLKESENNNANSSKNPKPTPTLTNNSEEKYLKLEIIELQKFFSSLGFLSNITVVDETSGGDGYCSASISSLNLDQIVLEYSQLQRHAESCCNVLALLGFSSTELSLAKIFKYFSKETCPGLAGKPKLFYVEMEIPNDERTDFMSGVDIPEDSLVIVSSSLQNNSPGLLSFFLQICQKMIESSPTNSFSVEELCAQLAFLSTDPTQFEIVIKCSLEKQWIIGHLDCNM